MREYNYTFDKGLGKGLRPSDKNPRNSQFLVESVGMFTEYGFLQSLDQLSVLDTSALTTHFPYPQMFVLANMTLVCTHDAVYQVQGATLVPLVTGIAEGVTWTCADFITFVLLTNGKVGVKNDPDSGAWTTFDDTDGELPMGICYCHLNGQLLIGGPGAIVPDGGI